MAVALSETDVAGMLEVLHEAAIVDGPDAFTEPVVDALSRLLPVDGGACCNVFAGQDPSIPADRLTIVDFASCGAEWIQYGPTLWREEMTEAVAAYGREEEVTPPTPELMLLAVRETDMLSYRETRKRHLWWEVDRHFGYDSLALWLPAPEEGVMRRLNFTTLERRAIPDRYVQILQLLAPHFVVLLPAGRGEARARGFFAADAARAPDPRVRQCRQDEQADRAGAVVVAAHGAFASRERVREARGENPHGRGRAGVRRPGSDGARRPALAERNQAVLVIKRGS